LGGGGAALKRGASQGGDLAEKQGELWCLVIGSGQNGTEVGPQSQRQNIVCTVGRKESKESPQGFLIRIKKSSLRSKKKKS